MCACVCFVKVEIKIEQFNVKCVKPEQVRWADKESQWASTCAGRRNHQGAL